MKTRTGFSILAALALAAGVGAGAQAPASGAARLSIAEGQVRISQVAAGGTRQVVTDQAVANTPLFEGYEIQTGDDGRVEIQFSDGTVGRVPPDSTLALTSLRPGDGEMNLTAGLGYFELRDGKKVRFAGGLVNANGSATIRVKLDETPGELAVLQGSAHIEGQGGATADLHGGESVKLTADGGGLNVAESVEPDSWDAWNSDRDAALTAAAGSATPATKGFADSGNPAWGDLNQNGNWYDVPGQGQVWSPYAASDSGWDPYGNGYWMDTPGYGYTWVSGESWGYLPYQCGLWNWYGGFGWGWAPGVCSPWWGGGGIWIINVGTWPGGWRPPLRPRRPHGTPLPRGGNVGVRPIQVRREGPPVNGVLPLRDRKTPVTIAGATVVPQRPVASRPVYNHQPAVPRFGNAPVNGLVTTPNAPGRPGYVQSPGTTGTRPGYNWTQSPTAGPGVQPVAPRPVIPRSPSGSSYARPAPGGGHAVAPAAPAPRPAAPPPAPHVAPASPHH